MCRIIRGPRTPQEIAEELARRGWVVEVDRARGRLEAIPPADATAEEREAVARFLREVILQAIAKCGLTEQIEILIREACE